MIAMKGPAVLLLALLAVGCSSAGAVEEGRYSLTVVTQHEHDIGPDQVTVGPMVIAGGTVNVHAGAEHRGLVVALAGQLEIDGLVDGDLLALGADIVLGQEAVITGDLQQSGGTVVRAAGATVRGQVTDEADMSRLLDVQGQEPSTTTRLGWVAFTIAAMAGLAWFVARAAPRLTARVEDAATCYPMVSGALGTLVLIMAPALIVSMVFTLVLIPVALVLLALLGVVLVYGLIGIGVRLGALVAQRLGWHLGRPSTAMLGTGALVVGLLSATLVPFLGSAALAVASAVGTGAVLITGFGTRTYRPPPDITSLDGDHGGCSDVGRPDGAATQATANAGPLTR